MTATRRPTAASDSFRLSASPPPLASCSIVSAQPFSLTVPRNWTRKSHHGGRSRSSHLKWRDACRINASCISRFHRLSLYGSLSSNLVASTNARHFITCQRCARNSTLHSRTINFYQPPHHRSRANRFQMIIEDNNNSANYDHRNQCHRFNWLF